jgi:hypothetical protein
MHSDFPKALYNADERWSSVSRHGDINVCIIKISKLSSTFGQGRKKHPHKMKRRKAHWTGHSVHRNCPIKHVIEGEIGGPVRRGRRCKRLLNDLKKKRRYWNLKETEVACTPGRTRFE